MEGAIDADAPLDYAEFHLIPSQNRYEARVCSGHMIEILVSGLLEQLSRHIPEVNELSSKGSILDFKIHPPDDLGDAKWFTKSTLTRFLCIVSSSDVLISTNAFVNEIIQLEESRKFHLSLHAKGREDQFGSGKADDDNSSGRASYLKPEVETMSSDASKNELLLAMNLRLSALREELASAFNQVTGAMFSPNEISDLERFSHYVGAVELRSSLCKLVELSQRNQTADLLHDNKSHSVHKSSNDSVRRTEGNPKMSKSHSDTRVKYGASPAKVAQLERQSSTESEESSYSSEEDQPSVERSRTLIRSASPRRSASPMRRIQIGRSGSRRAAALTIKNLNNFPARMSHRDANANGSEEEGSDSERPPKKAESNVVRISVQDAISLFESKQKDQPVGIQKQRSSLNASVGANKAVLRRWSSGMGDSSAQCLPDIVSESSVQTAPNCLEDRETPKNSVEEKSESAFVSGGRDPVESEVGVKLDASEKGQSCLCIEEDGPVIQKQESNEKLTASAEWTRQKEAELNQMLMKMMETKPVKYQGAAPNNCKSQDVPSQQRGVDYHHFKEKRDEKLRGETAGKRAEKEPKFRGRQKILDERKAKIGSANSTDAGKKKSLGKPQKSNKSLSQSANLKKETSKPAVTKTTTSKKSPLPAMLKSLPSAPSPRATGISPAKTPGSISSAGTTPTRRKPQPALSVPRSNQKVRNPQESPKVERPQQRPKIVKESNDSNKSIKGMHEKKQQPVSKNGKPTKTKSQTTSGDHSPMAPAKPSFYNKVTKKSSVVPLESKPFLRKGSRIGPGVVKTKVSSQPEESMTNTRNLTQAEENDEVVTVTNTSDMVIEHQEMVLEAVESHAHLESQTVVNIPENSDDVGSSDRVTANGDNSFKNMDKSASKTEDIEESIISPAAWVEIEESCDLPVPWDNIHEIEIASPVDIAAVVMSSPRVRHSLSQMLLEESSECDTVEWGNAENPPATVYQKDEPKGLKRLLKFARKSKADANVTGWSSPSAFSEGEDEAEESKAFSRKNGDNLLRKATLHAKNHGQQKSSSYEGRDSGTTELLSARSNIGKFTAQSNSHKFQEAHISTAAITTRATRSFFSLSAFRGSKPNETKIR